VVVSKDNLHSRDDWPYQITIATPDWYLAQQWCETNVGVFDQDWYKLGIDPADYFAHGKTRSTWLFRREQDAVAFALRWS
jgi:hypothetical protein